MPQHAFIIVVFPPKCSIVTLESVHKLSFMYPNLRSLLRFLHRQYSYVGGALRVIPFTFLAVGFEKLQLILADTLYITYCRLHNCQINNRLVTLSSDRFVFTLTSLLLSLQTHNAHTFCFCSRCVGVYCNNETIFV